MPTPPVGLTGTVSAIATGDLSTYTVVDGDVYGWGFGEFGSGSTTWMTPMIVAGVTDAVAIGAGGQGACVLSGAGELICWGAPSASAAPRVIGEIRPERLVPGDRHFCVIDDGALFCWGANTYGQLGDGTTVDRAEPARVLDLPSPVVAAAGGNMHTCALANEQVWCWGRSHRGQVGDGTTATRERAVLVLDGAVAVEAGHAHTCALTIDGNVRCWGMNGNGQIGDGHPGLDAVEPALVVPPAAP